MSLSPFPKETYAKNAEIYKVLANPKRLEVLNILKNSELTVDALAKEIRIRKANLSQHLFVLRLHKLVRVRSRGRNRFYSIANPRLVESCRILNELRDSRDIA